LPTKNAVKKAIKKGLLTVNDKLGQTATFVRSGDVISFQFSIDQNPKKAPKLNLKVLFEDDHLAIVLKPPGILVSGNRFVTVANGLAQNLTPSTQSDATMPYPIHRLDYGTSGALLVGKTARSIRALSQLFEDKAIEKTYYAITINRHKETQGQVDTIEDNKTLRSHFRLLSSVHSERFERLNLVQLTPETGRTHQLRKHMSFIGNPILGDRDYGIADKVLKGKGMYLHAFSLKFIHPINQQLVYCEAPLPKKFKKIFPESIL